MSGRRNQLLCVYLWSAEHPSNALALCATLQVDEDLGDMLPATIS